VALRCFRGHQPLTLPPFLPCVDVQRINKCVSEFGKSFYAPVTDNTTQELVDATLQFMKVSMNLITVTKRTPRHEQRSDNSSSPFAYAKEAVREQLIHMLKIVVQAKGKAAEYRVEHERRQQRQSLVLAMRRTGEISLELTNCMDAPYLNRSEFNGHLAEITKCIRDSIQSEDIRECLLPLVKVDIECLACFERGVGVCCARVLGGYGGGGGVCVCVCVCVPCVPCML
jgi:hypothetical protein